MFYFQDNLDFIPVHASYLRVGINGTTAISRKRKFVPSSHPGPFAVVASSRKSQTKVGTLAYFSFLYQNELPIYVKFGNAFPCRYDLPC